MGHVLLFGCVAAFDEFYLVACEKGFTTHTALRSRWSFLGLVLGFGLEENAVYAADYELFFEFLTTGIAFLWV